MTRDITPAGPPATGAVDEAFAEVRASFDRFCLAAGIEALGTMMEADVTAACGPRRGRDAARRAHRWGRTRGRIGFHGGKIEVERPRVRGVDGREVTIPSWETAVQEDWLGRWAMNLMLINVSTRRFGRAVRLPEGDVPAPPGSGVSKSAASRRFVALSAARLADFMAADLSALDLLVVQIDGLGEAHPQSCAFLGSHRETEANLFIAGYQKIQWLEELRVADRTGLFAGRCPANPLLPVEPARPLRIEIPQGESTQHP